MRGALPGRLSPAVADGTNVRHQRIAGFHAAVGGVPAAAAAAVLAACLVAAPSALAPASASALDSAWDPALDSASDPALRSAWDPASDSPSDPAWSPALRSALASAHTSATAPVRPEPAVEWNGPLFRAVTDTTAGSLVEDPSLELPFLQPAGLAARRHDGRDVVYVLDAGRHRIQAFEVDARLFLADPEDFTYAGDEVEPGPGQFSSSRLRLPCFAAVPRQWIVPESEILCVDGVRWRRVPDLAGFHAGNHVYRIDYARDVDGPEISVPRGAFHAGRRLDLRCVLSDYRAWPAAGPRFGLGDVDYGVHDSTGAVHRVLIDERVSGVPNWREPRALALLPDAADTTRDVLFVIDIGAGPADPGRLWSCSVDLGGDVRPGEHYADGLLRPGGLGCAEGPIARAARAWIEGDGSPFDAGAGPLVVEAAQVTGRDYRVTVAHGAGAPRVTIEEAQTGRLVAEADSADLADPFLGLPGLCLPLAPGDWPAGTTTVRTRRALPGRYLLVTDEVRDRFKVIGLPGASGGEAPAAWPGPWLAAAARRTEPAVHGLPGQIGADPRVELEPRTPDVVPDYWCAWTLAFPLAENSLEEIVFDPAGRREVWRRTADLMVAGPDDAVFQLDEEIGRLRFGDGLHGRVPPSATPFAYAYRTSPDVVRHGSTGTGDDRLTAPRGIAARWNPTWRRFDVYVVDSGNERVCKYAFLPADTLPAAPPRMEYLGSWNRAEGGGDPEERAASWFDDRPLAAPSGIALTKTARGEVLLAVVERGAPAVTVFADREADNAPGAAPPRWRATVGALGNGPGELVEPSGAAFLSGPLDGSAEPDLYVADAARGIVLKCEAVPPPSISLRIEGESALPASFPPHSGYPISFRVRRAPPGGWVDFYFDEAETFRPQTARLCLPARSVAPYDSTVFWSFRESPGGPPPAGNFHLFALLRDASGRVVAADRTPAGAWLTIDPSLSPALVARDALDLDRTLYLQNRLERNVLLQLSWPDGAIGAAFGGSFDTALVRVLSIVPGPAFDGLGATHRIFTSDFDNAAGVFRVGSTVTGAPSGLVAKGPHTVAILRLRARDDAVTPEVRARRGRLSFDRAACGITNAAGPQTDPWRTEDLSLRAGYLGDIATTGAGADSIVPHLQPAPDGRIDFDDQIAFTLGWNGSGTRDPIADLGPVEERSPDLLSNPDKVWNVDDVLVFTLQHSWFSHAGWNSEAGGQGGDDREDTTQGPGGLPGDLSSNRGSHPGAVHPDKPAATVFPRPAAGAAVPFVECRFVREAGGAASVLTIRAAGVPDLLGAELTVAFNAARLGPVEAVCGPLLAAGAQVLALRSDRPGGVTLGLTRLATGGTPFLGVSGGGEIARFTFVDRGGPGAGAATLRLAWDLRNTSGARIDADTMTIPLEIPGEEGASGRELPDHPVLRLVQPNPTAGSALLDLVLPARAHAVVALFDVAGRQRRVLLAGELPAGSHLVAFDGRDSAGRRLPPGVYLCRLSAAGRTDTRRLLIAH